MDLFEMSLHFVPGGFNMADHTFRELTSRYHSPQICNHFEVMNNEVIQKPFPDAHGHLSFQNFSAYTEAT